MKKHLLLLSAIFFVLTSFGQLRNSKIKCQAPSQAKSVEADWAMVGDFTSDDIDGNEHHLQSYLDDGKYVLVDLSCAWCPPCWTLHQSGVLEEIYEAYGPEGTDQVQVLWIEIESQNSLAQIQGTSEGSNTTQGDWTEGGEWPVPIIDDHTIVSSFSELYEGFVPTVFLVCPSGAYKLVSLYEGQSTISMANFEAMLETCPGDDSAPLADFTGELTGFINSDMTFTDASFSITDVTSWAWSFQSGTPETSSDQNPTVQWAEAGTYDVELVVTNSGGSNTLTKQVTILDAGQADNYHVTFEECLSFSESLAPYAWKSIDLDDAGGFTWNGFDFETETAAKGFFVLDQTGITGTAGNLTAITGTKASCAECVSGQSNDDWLISPLLTIGNDFEIKFKAKAYSEEWGKERFEVAVSTEGDDPANFTTLLSGEPYDTVGVDVENFAYSLADYAGQDIYIAIHAIGYEASFLIIDDIDVETANSINPVNFNFSIFPNPAQGYVNVIDAENATVKVYNNIGQMILSEGNISNNERIDLSSYEAGSYIIKVELNGACQVKHLVLTK